MDYQLVPTTYERKMAEDVAGAFAELFIGTIESLFK